jgi:hypothetical protein
VTAPASADGLDGPLDLEVAAKAAAAEADDKPFAFTYHGEGYTVPPAKQWPLSALRHVARGDLDDALPVLLGEEAYDRLADAGLTLGELNTLFEQIGRTYGIGSLPNSSPPRRPVSTRTSKRR